MTMTPIQLFFYGVAFAGCLLVVGLVLLGLWVALCVLIAPSKPGGPK